MSKLEFKKNHPKYHEFIRNLRNNKKVKSGFIKQKYISKLEQKKFMQKYGQNFFVCLCDGQPAGYIGVLNSDIRVAVHPDYMQKGIGLFLVNKVQKKYHNLQAKVKVNNLASQKLFKKAGFKIKYYVFENE
jgi:ribosomal protein S18 acetylase RimI-like enzyme